MNLAVYPSSHGFGHLTRSLEVFRALHELDSDIELHVRAPFDGERVHEVLGFTPASHKNLQFDIGLVQRDALHHDQAASLAALGNFFEKGQALVEEEADWLRSAKIDATLIDIPPHAFAASALAEVPAFGMGNFTWSAVWEDLAQSEPEFARFAEEARRWYSTAQLFYSGGMELGLEVFPEVVRVPMIARHSQRSPEEVRALLGLENDLRPILLLAFGSEALSVPPLVDPAIFEEYILLTSPPLAGRATATQHITDERLTSLGLGYVDLVRAANVAMIKPGYGTISECAANSTAQILIPRVGFIEADVLQAWVLKNLPSAMLPIEQFQRGEWSGTFKVLDEQKPWRFDTLATDGAKVIARDLVQRVTAR